MFVQEVPQRSHLHLQKVSGTGLVSGGLSQSFDNIRLLEVLEVGGQIQSVVGEIELGVDAFRIVIRNVLGQPLGLDLVTALESDGSLDRVFELTHISAPHVVFQKLHCLWRDGQIAPCLLAEFADKMTRKLRDIFRAIAQRRKLDRNY